MSAMEKMLGQMVGISPTEMKEMAGRVQGGVLEMAGAIKRIEDNQIKMLALLEELNARTGTPDNGSDRDLPKLGDGS